VERRFALPASHRRDPEPTPAPATSDAPYAKGSKLASLTAVASAVVDVGDAATVSAAMSSITEPPAT
jgi:hypothetical protein